VTPGNAAADRLAAKYGHTPPPARTSVATMDGPVCTCCDARVPYVVPAYWNPDVVRLCSACCQVWCEDHPDPRSWPVHPDSGAAA
jgi:hypothetical protein